MPTSVKQMIEAANAAVPRITPQQAREMMAKGNALIVDVRDRPEVEKTGKVAGAVHVSRGMLEFRADADTPYHDKNFAKERFAAVSWPAFLRWLEITTMSSSSFISPGAPTG
jgi:predicted sulfurtransferase